MVHEEVQQRLVAAGAKLERCKIEQSSTGRIAYLNQTRRDCSTN